MNKEEKRRFFLYSIVLLVLMVAQAIGFLLHRVQQVVQENPARLELELIILYGLEFTAIYMLVIAVREFLKERKMRRNS
uniref:Uncharacterized protein n=1 Tax=Sulfolobus neozealandicus TaxID=299422 RepID=Q5DVE2_9CREN|nr:hypothetical protein [Sulfolobus neozealandicus]